MPRATALRASKTGRDHHRGIRGVRARRDRCDRDRAVTRVAWSDRAALDAPTPRSAARACGGSRARKSAATSRERQAILRPARPGERGIDVARGRCRPRAVARRRGSPRRGTALGACNTPRPARRALRCGRWRAGSRACAVDGKEAARSRRIRAPCWRSVARSGMLSVATAAPKNSTNLPVTPCPRSRCVTRSARSVVVVPAGGAPAGARPRPREREYSWDSPSRAPRRRCRPRPSRARRAR